MSKGEKGLVEPELKNWQYWVVGWYMYLRHPFRKPIDYAKTLHMLTRGKS